MLAFVLAKPGATGPQLQPHRSGAPCEETAAGPSAASAIPNSFQQLAGGEFPALCRGILGLPPGVPGRSRFGGRDVSIPFIADLLSQRVNLGRPMIDATGLTGTFDFLLEFTPESTTASDPDGPRFEQALREQLGLKLQSRKSAMDVLVLDHIERPSENE